MLIKSLKRCSFGISGIFLLLIVSPAFADKNSEKAKGSALDTGQIEHVIGKNIFSKTVRDSGTIHSPKALPASPVRHKLVNSLPKT
jgi:hypothetical protein